MAFRTPEQTLAFFALVGLAIASFVVFIRWLFSGPITSDPWDHTVSVAVDEPDAVPVCHRCLTQHSDVDHFCRQCGSAVGDFNNMLPFEQLFSEGEVFRNGTMLKMPPTFLRVVGYLLVSTVAYSILAPLWFVLPVFWCVLFHNFTRQHEPSEADVVPPNH